MTPVDALLQDLHFAVRSYRKTPVFTLVALVTLTLAIGANTAIFSLLNALVLRDLPVRDPGTLVQLSSVAPGSTYESGLTFPMFRELPGRQQIFSSVIGWLGSTVMNIETEHEDTRGAIWVVTANFYSELGVRPMAGRTIGPGDVDDATLEPARVAVIGYSFWQRHYGGDRNAIGQRIRVEGQPFTIVGIAPEGFRGLNLTVEPDVTLPLTAYPLISDSPLASLGRGTSFWVRTTGRLKPGVIIEQARAALDTLWPELKRATMPAQYAGSQRDRFLATRLSVTPAGKGVEQRLRDTFLQPLVANAHVYDLKDPNLSAVYVPALQEPNNSWKCVIVRGRGVSFPSLSEAIASLGYERIGHTQALSYITDRVLPKERVTAMLATFFGGIALLLAAIGLYGLMSYAVAQRRREIGIRIALGADARRVVRTVVGEGLRVTLSGVVVGCAAALVAVRPVKSLLFGVSAYDPLTLVAAPALLVAIAIVACLVPALRAARVNPMIALRAE